MASPFPSEERDPALAPLLSDPTYNRVFIMIPHKFPLPVHVILSRATCITTKTRPHLTFSEVWVNRYSYYRMDMMGNWSRVYPRVLKEIILKPALTPPMLQNMMMVYPEEPGRLVPAHLPCLADVMKISELIGIFLKWWMMKMIDKFSDEVVPWELQFLSNPVPVLPQERKALSITKNWLMVEAGSETDNVKWLCLTKVCTQITLKMAWGYSKEGGGVMSGIKTKINGEILYSSKAQRMVTLDYHTHPEVHAELMNLPPPLNPGISILLWNTRGVARQGFRRNTKKLIRDHDPMIIIITETRVARESIEEIVSSLPFNSFETMEPLGYSGGILMLWNERLHSFTSITKEPRAIHGVIQVQNFPPFFISALYANTKYNGRIEMWDNLIDMSSNVNISWLVLGNFNEVTYAHENFGGNPLKSIKCVSTKTLWHSVVCMILILLAINIHGLIKERVILFLRD